MLMLMMLIKQNNVYIVWSMRVAGCCHVDGPYWEALYLMRAESRLRGSGGEHRVRW